ncbi:hypothetical protein ACIBQX_19175 [Nonomuraea sp. NPDC049714]|uniref:hypothetical protein n=1 Tax=Nonomuraea sp. NPDC049714 TaxID=3364357 RepID=UPI0037AE9A54
MTAVLSVKASPYTQLGVTYERELSVQGISPAMLAHKWQPADLLAPHSDLDIRILLAHPPQDWWEWNHRLAAAHTAVVSQRIVNRRVLEHPPGFAFMVPEVDQRRVSPAELATWSLISGHPRTFHRWKAQAQMAPWSRTDEVFYRSILNARVDGRYRLSADSTANVHIDLPGYRRHCILWHYLAPCWFAIASLATRTRCPGKFAALAQWHPPDLEHYGRAFARLARNHREQPLTDLLHQTHAAVTAAMRHLPAATGTGEALRSSCTMTAGMLRVRVARWVYYLDPPVDTATAYLVRREARELQTAAAALRAFAADQDTQEQRQAARMADLLPAGPTTERVLRDTLTVWRRHRTLVEDFLNMGGPS